MNLNPIDFNYIDGENIYPIQEYIDEKINNNNIYNTYSSNIILNNNQKLDKSLYYSNACNLNHQTNNLILSNNYNFGEIKFETFFKYANNNQIGTKIDYTGKLFLYHNYNLFQPTILEGYYDIDFEIAQLKADGVATDIQLTGIEGVIVTITDDITAINGELLNLNSAVIFLDESVSLIQEEIEYIAGELPQRAEILTNAEQSGELLGAFGDFLIRDRDIIGNSINKGLQFGVGAVGLGVISAIFGFVYNDRMSNMANNINSSNFQITEGDRSNLIYQADSQNFLYANNYISGTSNLNLIQGFTNSNIITQQYLNAININELKLNQTNVSNIFVSSNVASNTSNVLNNKIDNTSNLIINNINYNSNLIINNSNTTTNLLFNINYTIEREYPSKLYTSFSSQSVITYLTQNPTYYETITLNTTDISYGSGTYEIYSSSIDDTIVSFSGTGSTLNNVSGNTDYAYISFINNGTFTINNNLICDILIVGGGGGGGSRHGGGGGAGSVIYLTNQNLSTGTYNINIGLGGTSSTSGQGGKGGDSTIILNSTTIYNAKGGGAGYHASSSGNSNKDGGSGGGGGDVIGYAVNTNIPTGIYGNNGGIIIGTGGESTYAGGGGGGSETSGANGTLNGNLAIGGNGGNGKLISITGTNIYYGGGGGGGCASTAQSAGLGG